MTSQLIRTDHKERFWQQTRAIARLKFSGDICSPLTNSFFLVNSNTALTETLFCQNFNVKRLYLIVAIKTSVINRARVNIISISCSAGG